MPIGQRVGPVAAQTAARAVPTLERGRIAPRNYVERLEVGGEERNRVVRTRRHSLRL